MNNQLIAPAEVPNITRDIYIKLAERALEKAQTYKAKGDVFLAKGKNRRADQAFRIAERAMLRFQTMAVLCG